MDSRLSAPTARTVPLAAVNLRHLAQAPPRRKPWRSLLAGVVLTAVAAALLLRWHAAPAKAAVRVEHGAASTVSSFLDASSRHDDPAAQALLCREYRQNPPAPGESPLLPGVAVTAHTTLAAHVYGGASGGLRANSSAWVRERLTLADGSVIDRTYQLVVDDQQWRVCGTR